MGGAAGHMAHPFDLPEVNTGNDLINFFEEAAEYLVTNPASVKIDGVNVSFKLIDGPRGKEFAVDRGSTKPIDIEGITLSRVGERFPEGHGMRPAIKILLNIFNKALPNIQDELQKLGMWESPTIFLNTEYVTKGKTNVQEYDKNFLAIHGVNQFYEKTNARTGVQRPGAERPMGNKAPSVEVPYNDEVFNSLIEKVRPAAAEFDFEIYGSVPTTSVAGADFSSTLATPFSVNYGYDGEGKLFSDTKPLGQWLNEANNPRGAFIVLANGKKAGALSKLVYTEILNGTPMTELLAVGEEFWDSVKKGAPLEGTDVEKAVDGAVFYHATRMLGNDVLKTLTSDMGPVESHEGAVVRGISSVPVKITGEFILGGLQTSFREHKELNEQLEEKRHLALIPGGFKPPHKGHLEMVKFYYKNVGPGGKVIVLMGSGGKHPRTINGRPITLQDSMDIWETYLRNDPDIEWPSDRIQFQNVEGAGPIAPIIDYVREQADPETEVIHLGAGEKDAGRWKMMMDSPKNNPRGVEIRIAPAPNLFDAQGNPLSASAMRQAVEEKDLETFKNYIPNTSLHMAEDIYVKLRGALLMEEKEDSPLPLGIFLRLIEEAIDEKENLLTERRPPDQGLWPTPPGEHDSELFSSPEIRKDPPEPIDPLRLKILKSYINGPNRAAWTWERGYIWREMIPNEPCYPNCTQEDVERIYKNKIFPDIEEAILETEITHGFDSGDWLKDEKGGARAGYYRLKKNPFAKGVAGDIHIVSDPDRKSQGWRPLTPYEKEEVTRHELGHAIDYSAIKRGDKCGPDETANQCVNRLAQSGRDFEKMREAFPWLSRTGGKEEFEKPQELYDVITIARPNLPRYRQIKGTGADGDWKFTEKDVANIRSGNFTWPAIEREYSPGPIDFRDRKKLQKALQRNEELGIGPSDEEMADIWNQISQVDPIQDPFQEPTVVAENTFSSNELLRLIEEVMAHARNNDLKVWNPAALEAANKNEDEELEEASSMAGGNITGASGVAGNKPPGKRDDEYLIREEEEDPFVGPVKPVTRRDPEPVETTKELANYGETRGITPQGDIWPDTRHGDIGRYDIDVAKPWMQHYEKYVKQWPPSAIKDIKNITQNIVAMAQDDMIESYTSGVGRNNLIKFIEKKHKMSPEEASKKYEGEYKGFIIDTVRNIPIDIITDYDPKKSTEGSLHSPYGKGESHGTYSPAFNTVKLHPLRSLYLQAHRHGSGRNLSRNEFEEGFYDTALHEIEHAIDHAYRNKFYPKKSQYSRKHGYQWGTKPEDTLGLLSVEQNEKIKSIAKGVDFHKLIDRAMESGNEKEERRLRNKKNITEYFLSPTEFRSFTKMEQGQKEKKLKNLFKKGAISQEEYNAKIKGPLFTLEDIKKKYKEGRASKQNNIWKFIDCSSPEKCLDVFNTFAKAEPIRKPTRMVAEQKNDQLVEEVVNYLLHKNGAK